MEFSGTLTVEQVRAVAQGVGAILLVALAAAWVILLAVKAVRAARHRNPSSRR